MSDAPPGPRARIRRIRRAVATAAAIVFLGAWAAVGALGKGAAATEAAASTGAAAGAASDEATSSSDALPPVVTSQS
jgi:hypothetical protein